LEPDAVLISNFFGILRETATSIFTVVKEVQGFGSISYNIRKAVMRCWCFQYNNCPPVSLLWLWPRPFLSFKMQPFFTTTCYSLNTLKMESASS